MTQGTIYNYVSSKDDILYLVCDRIVAEYNEQARGARHVTGSRGTRSIRGARDLDGDVSAPARDPTAHPMAPRRRQTSSPLS